MKKIYEVGFNFIQSVIGEAIGESEDEVRGALLEEFKDLPGYEITKLVELGDYTQLDIFNENNTVN